MLNFLICDDNLDSLNKLSHIFESIFMKHDLEAQIAFETTNETELFSYIEENPIDVFVLDINLNSKLSGLDIAKIIRSKNKNCYIIFVTAHSEFVFVAYKCKTFDFLHKPISKEILEDTILRLFDDINGKTTNKKYLRLDNKNTLIDENEVQYIKRDGMKLIFQTNSENYEIYSSFTKVQDQLPKNFVRCHKSFIVNINNIKKLDSASNLIYFKNNHTCDIGPKYKNELMKEVKVYE